MKSLFENETKRLYLLLALLLIIIVFTLFYGRFDGKNILKEMEDLIESNEPKLIYIIRDGCKYCELNESNITLMENEYNLSYYKIDTAKLTKNDLTKLLEKLDVDAANFGTPYMKVVQNGKSIDSLSGLTSYNILFDFLKNNNLINSSAKLKLNYPDLSNYNRLINSTNDEVIVLATSYCPYCLKEHPVLVDIANKYNIKINYVYLDYLFNSKEEYDEFLTSLKWFSENEDWGTPTMLIVNNKEVKKSLENYRSEADIVAFLKDNGIIK